jgi:hypothetical protein
VRLLLLVLCCWASGLALAQLPERDIGAPIDTLAQPKQEEVNIPSKTVIKDTSMQAKHSPKTATLLSLCLPGAGQVYNRNNWWWKVPIIYGGGAALVYGAVFYQKNYLEFKRAYEFTQLNPGQPTGNPRFDRVRDPATLRRNRDNYREARDQCFIGLGVLYALQVVDAAVEAHFFDFNVSENLSLNIQPQFIPAGAFGFAGLQLTMKLK